MSKWEQVGQELAEKLQGVEDESSIQKLAIAVVEQIRNYYSQINSRKAPLKEVRNAIKSAFPQTKTQEHSWQYFTNKGPGNVERYQHLALKYLTFSSKEWDAVGDKARQQWQAQQSQQQLETPAQTTLDDMNISQLQLDAETQQIVENAIAFSGMPLGEFVRKACQVYAKTVTGKFGQYETDLAAVPTKELLTSATYKTHPGRAEELTRRAIYALESHNNQCTEKSQKWMITQTAIQSLTGSKPATIKGILERYQQRIDDHNTKHQLTVYDNRKRDRKIDSDINLAELVTDGIDLI